MLLQVGVSVFCQYIIFLQPKMTFLSLSSRFSATFSSKAPPLSLFNNHLEIQISVMTLKPAPQALVLHSCSTPLMAASQILYQLPMAIQQATPKADFNQKQSLSFFFFFCRSAIWIELIEEDSSRWHVVQENWTLNCFAWGVGQLGVSQKSLSLTAPLHRVSPWSFQPTL